MSNTTKCGRLSEVCVLVALVALGAGLRVFFRDLPNFAPVAALAMFSGFFFRNWWTALSVPLAVMAISDYFIGGYAWQVTVVVYASLTLPVGLRGVLRRWIPLKRSGLTSVIVAIVGLMTCALGSSLVFYLTTNFACWIWFDTNHTWVGLLHNYIRALPFFRFTVAGDLLFTCALFGGHALYALATRRDVVATSATSPFPIGYLDV
jgi:hypothetical protein